MVNINIEIPDELHKKIKLASVIGDCTIKDYVVSILEKKAKECKLKDAEIKGAGINGSSAKSKSKSKSGSGSRQ